MMRHMDVAVGVDLAYSVDVVILGLGGVVGCRTVGVTIVKVHSLFRRSLTDSGIAVVGKLHIFINIGRN